MSNLSPAIGELPEFQRLWPSGHAPAFLLRALSRVRVSEPTPIQRAVLPVILGGRTGRATSSSELRAPFPSIVAQAPTGSGKTLCFLLPILELLHKDPYGVAALILVPTRELGFQIEESAQALGKEIGVTTAVVCGGKDEQKQRAKLATRPHIAIATPGRLAASLAREVDRLRLAFAKTQVVVLDEADRLLSEDSFGADLRTIGGFLRSGRDSEKQGRVSYLLFSATMSEDVLRTGAHLDSINVDTREALRVQKREERVRALAAADAERRADADEDEEEEEGSGEEGAEEAGTAAEAGSDEADEEQLEMEVAESERTITPDRLSQYFLLVPGPLRLSYLTELLETYLKGKSCIVFCQTVEECEVVATALSFLKIHAVTLHAGQSQAKRLVTLAKFKSKECRLLVATDLAARGLDVPSVEAVVNLGMPQGPATEYVHRIGRCARAGQAGEALTFICNKQDGHKATAVQQLMGRKMLDFRKLPKTGFASAKADLRAAKVNKAEQEAFNVLDEAGFFEQRKKRARQA